MKTRKVFFGLASLALAVLTFAGVHSAVAQGTAFTYQGRLTDNGNPANGEYDLTFAVFDALSAGNQAGATLTNAPTSVSNGLFTVTLDFGGGVFTGDPRWLEIGVATGGNGGDFTPLSPRQALTPTPYAIHANTASNVVPGSVVKSLNSLLDDVTLAAGSNVTITPSGNTLTIDSAGVGGSGIWNLNGADTYFDTGNVGIGTISPTPGIRLEVNGAARLTPGGTGGTITFGTPNAETGMTIAAGTARADLRFDGSTLKLVALAGGGVPPSEYGIAVTTNGSVGIGTASPTPGNRLEVNGAALLTPGGSGGVIGFGTPNGETGMTIGGNNRADIRFDGSTLKLVALAGGGVPPSEYGIAINTSGNVGIGTTTPQERLSILDFSGGSSSGLNITGIGADGVGMAIQSIGPGGHKWALVSGGFFNPVVPSIAGNFRIVDETANAARLVIAPDGNVGIGSLGTPQAKLDVQGTTRTCVLTITGGCDLAEPFPMKTDDLPKGSVVVIDNEHPGRLMRSEHAYDTRVAGIISGANGINPGITLQQEGAFADGQNVALSGRVYVQADAASGAIKPGDLLTTSDTRGHAMKVTDHAKAQGAILGKAMSTLKEGKGLVLVLVTLQ